MHGEYHVIQEHRIQTARISAMEFILHCGVPVEGTIEDRVKDETDDVQRHEIEIQTDHRLPPPVQVYLRVEGHRPGHKVQPAADLREANEPRLETDPDTNVGIGDQGAAKDRKRSKNKVKYEKKCR